MKIFGQIEEASLEQLAVDPASNTQGRIYTNTAEGRVKVDDGVSKRALLRNDQKMIIGNDPTPANNVRIHKGPSGVIQDVAGNDATAEGSSSSAIAQRSTRDENLTSLTLPAAGNIGRNIFLTDEKVTAIDDGSAFRKSIPEFVADDATTGGTVTLAAISSSVVRLTGAITTLSMIPAGFSGQRATIINRSGADMAISHDSGATPANRIYTGTNANLTFKNNSALPLYYDATTQRWQVLSEASGATSGGGTLPNSSLIVATTTYNVLITDDVILLDASGGPFSVTLPTAAGNLGKVLVFEKIEGRDTAVVTIVGTINGISNEEIRQKNAPFIIVSDGTDWKTLSKANGHLFFAYSTTPLLAAAYATSNVSLETLSAASATNIDNAIVKTGNTVALFGQTAAEENGIYTVPATNIVIAATAVANTDISLLANGSIVNVTVVSTGDKVSLRFQTDPAENGIYVVGATPGTSVRDISQRHSSYTTPATLKDLVIYADWYNHSTTTLALAPTEPGGSPVHANDQKFWRQSNDYLTAFSEATISGPNVAMSIPVKIPSNAQAVTLEICPFGGGGGGGSTASHGGGGAVGCLPLLFSSSVTPGTTLSITYPSYARPGTGRTNQVGATGSSIVVTMTPLVGPAINYSFPGGVGGGTTAGGAPVNVAGGPLHLAGGVATGGGAGSFFASGGTSTGTQPGGGGGAGVHNGGNGGAGTTAANTLGTAGGGAVAGEYGGGGGGGGAAPASGRPGRGGIGKAGYVKVWFS